MKDAGFCLCSEFLAPGARDPVNVDCRVAETVRKNIEDSADRFCFDEAEVSEIVRKKE